MDWLIQAFRWLLGLLRKPTTPVLPPVPPTPKSEPKSYSPPEGLAEEPTQPASPAREVAPEPTPEEPAMARPTLSRGTSDKAAAKELQALLNKNGERLTVDGDFGGGTETAVKGFQLSYGLGQTGVADAAVWAILDRPPYFRQPAFKSVKLVPDLQVSGSKSVATAWNKYGGLLAALSEDLGFSPSSAAAVLAVESAGEGFWDGKMVIRFENHIFYRWGKDHADVYKAHFRFNNSSSWKDHSWRPDTRALWRPLHTKEAGQAEEWAALEYARTLDDTAALNSISMGAPQIMGFNSAKIGFSSVQEMFEAFNAGDRAHICGLFDFIRSDHLMVRALRTEDWTGFAGIYNGGGQKDYYGGKIGENVQKAKGLGIP